MTPSKLLLIALGVTALAGCSQTDETAPQIRPVLSVIVEPVAEGSAAFVGTVQPHTSTVQAFRIGGTLVNRNVGLGDAVTRDQVLAGIETTTLSLAVQTAQANLSNAQAQAANAAATLNRLEALLQTNNASQADVEQAQQQTLAGQAGVVQAQSRLTQSQEQLGYAQIVAGFDGIVTAVGAETGEVVAPGQMIVTLAQPDDRDLVIDVPERVVQDLALGTQFAISPQLDPATVIVGKLREIAPEADPVTRSWQLRIGLENPPASFWLGTTAMARLDTAAQPQIIIPQSAIKREGNTTSVWIVDETMATVSLRPVEIGEAGDGQVPVLSGLEAGERLVIAGANSLQQGQQIRLDQDSAR